MWLLEVEEVLPAVIACGGDMGVVGVQLDHPCTVVYLLTFCWSQSLILLAEMITYSETLLFQHSSPFFYTTQRDLENEAVVDRWTNLECSLHQRNENHSLCVHHIPSPLFYQEWTDPLEVKLPAALSVFHKRFLYHCVW